MNRSKANKVKKQSIPNSKAATCKFERNFKKHLCKLKQNEKQNQTGKQNSLKSLENLSSVETKLFQEKMQDA